MTLVQRRKTYPQSLTENRQETAVKFQYTQDIFNKFVNTRKFGDKVCYFNSLTVRNTTCRLLNVVALAEQLQVHVYK